MYVIFYGGRGRYTGLLLGRWGVRGDGASQVFVCRVCAGERKEKRVNSFRVEKN